MTHYQFTVTIPAAGGANRVRLSTQAIAASAVLPGNCCYSASYLPACKLFVQAQKAASGGFVFMGNSSVDEAGAGGAIQLGAGTSTSIGGSAEIADGQNANTVDLSEYYIHGAHPGDVVTVQYSQN